MDELVHISKSLADRDLFYVTYKTPRTARMERTYLLPNILQSRLALLLSFLMMLIIFIRKTPEIVISTGAEIAVPGFVVGKFFGCRLVFVESLCRVKSPSGTGRLLYRMSDLFIIQWPELSAAYGKNATYIGGIS